MCGVCKMFGEWYQKTNKTEDINKLTLLAVKIIAILHNTLFDRCDHPGALCFSTPVLNTINTHTHTHRHASTHAHAGLEDSQRIPSSRTTVLYLHHNMFERSRNVWSSA
jgi:hypothetical protein